MRSLLRFDVAAIALELTALIAFVASAWVDTQDPAATHTLVAQTVSLGVLLQGEASWAFWGAFIAAGLFAPLCVEVLALTKVSGLMRPAPSFCAAACVLVGGFALRACIVWAGVHPVVSSASAMLIG